METGKVVSGKNTYLEVVVSYLFFSLKTQQLAIKEINFLKLQVCTMNLLHVADKEDHLTAF